MHRIARGDHANRSEQQNGCECVEDEGLEGHTPGVIRES
jgi:hypothetical protein